MAAVGKFQQEGLSIDKMLEKLKESGLEKIPSKGTLHSWIKGAEGIQSTA